MRDPNAKTLVNTALITDMRARYRRVPAAKPAPTPQPPASPRAPAPAPAPRDGAPEPPKNDTMSRA